MNNPPGTPRQIQPPGTGGAVIDIRGLTKEFGRLQVLRGVDLSLERGDCVALLGPNGAGKTTLIRILATLSRPSQGDVYVAGRSILREDRHVRRLIGLVSHQTFLYGDLTAEENLHFYGRLYGARDLSERVPALLEQVGLYHRRRDPVRTYSRGMQQRLSIARSIVHDPPILLLDEPDTGLDQSASRVLGDLLRLFNAGSRTVLMTSHHLERAQELSRRVVMLVDGQLCWEGETAHMGPGELSRIYDEQIQARAPGKGGRRR